MTHTLKDTLQREIEAYGLNGLRPLQAIARAVYKSVKPSAHNNPLATIGPKGSVNAHYRSELKLRDAARDALKRKRPYFFVRLAGEEAESWKLGLPASTKEVMVVAVADATGVYHLRSAYKVK